MAEAAGEFLIGGPQGGFRVHAGMARKVHHGEQQVAHLSL